MMEIKSLEPESGVTWAELATRNKQILEINRTASVNDVDWIKWRKKKMKSLFNKNTSATINDKFVNLSIEHVKKSTMIENFVERKEEVSGKRSDESVDDDDGSVTSKAPSLNLKTDLIDDFNPRVFSMIDLDPNNIVNITSAIRGNISSFSTALPPEHDYFPQKSGNDCSECSEEEPSDICLLQKQYMINADIIICDVTRSRSKILETWNLLRAFSRFFQTSSDNSENKVKTIILISSLMTWENTEEISSTPDFKLHEIYYTLRSSHEAFMPMFLLENELIKLGCEYKDWLRVLIVSTGLIYGPAEHDLSPLFETSLNDKPELPIFGTGQNIVPLIHINDLISLLNTIIHNFPENYEFIFAVEPEPLTQSQIVNSLCKYFGNNINCRTVSSKFSLLYDFNEEDVFKLSANLPLESSYLTIIEWKNQHKFVQSILPLARRYYTINRTFKPPCIVISAPSSKRVENIIHHLNELLGTENLSKESIIQSYLSYLGPRDVASKKWAQVEKSISELSSLPRGEGLIKVINRMLLQPKVQKNGYILSGFPETYKEAILFYKILKNISDSDASNFPDYPFNNSLTPDNVIVLLMNDEDAVKEANYLTDERGSFSAEILINLDHFRSKLTEKSFAMEFFEEQQLFPKLFNVGEYSTDEECAEQISEIIKSSKQINDISSAEEEIISVPTLLNLMFSKGTIKKSIKPSEEETTEECHINLSTRWKKFDEIKDFSQNNIDSERNGANCDDEKRKLSLAFPFLEEELPDSPSNDQDKTLFETGVYHDKISKPLEGMDGIVSKCCLKNIKPSKSISAVPGSISAGSLGQRSTKKSQPYNKEIKKSCKVKGTPGRIKDEISPNIEWSGGSNNVLTGVVVCWCKPLSTCREMSLKSDLNVFPDKSLGSDGEPVMSELKEISQANAQERVFSNSAESSKATYDKNVHPYNNVNTETSSASGLKLDRTWLRGSPLFVNDKFHLYKDWLMFFDMDSNDYLFVNKIENEDAISLLNTCSGNLFDAKQYFEIETLCRRREVKANNDDNRSKPIIKFGEAVQTNQLCCGKDQKSAPSLKINRFENKFVSDNTATSVAMRRSSGSQVVTEPSNSSIHESTSEDIMTASSRSSGDEMQVADTTKSENDTAYLTTNTHDTIFITQMSVDFEYAIDSSITDPTNWKASAKISETSNNSGRSILKQPSISSASVKRSSTSINRKVRFSSGEDDWSIKTFEDKFNSWIDIHLEELKENEPLRQLDSCTEEKASESCGVYFYKNLLEKVNSDWRNEHLHSLRDRSNSRSKIVNYNEVQKYFTKHWSHFRTSPPDLELLPTSVMLQIEKNYICDSLRSRQKTLLDAQCNNRFNTDKSCICKVTYENKLSVDTKANEMQNRDTLSSGSSLDVFDKRIHESTTTDIEKDNSSCDYEADLPEKTKENPILYINCKRTSSWESNDEQSGNLNNSINSNESLVSFWHNKS